VKQGILLEEREGSQVPAPSPSLVYVEEAGFFQLLILKDVTCRSLGTPWAGKHCHTVAAYVILSPPGYLEQYSTVLGPLAMWNERQPATCQIHKVIL
jgi:hypothetical protein